MNRLSIAKQAQVIAALVEGNSIRATCRMTGAAKGTVTRLLVNVGYACADYQDSVMRNLPCRVIQCDEIWAFCYAKQKNVPEEKKGTFGYGDVYTWVAIDADSKLVPCFHVGKRDLGSARVFIDDLAGRLSSRVQLTTDGHKAYLQAVEDAFGCDIDYAMLVKMYGAEEEKARAVRYSPPKCTGAIKERIEGNPDPSLISTSYVERQNLTMRMSMRRFTRLTNAFSKKVENLECAVALHFMHYNFARPHKSLANPYPRTPAMAIGIETRIWKIVDILNLLDSN
jgi:IS1 family transposase